MNTPHPLPTAAASQCDRILAVLTKDAGNWVPMPLLGVLSGSRNVHSRIDELRKKRGLTIDHKQETEGRSKYSYYRLPSTTAPTPAQ